VYRTRWFYSAAWQRAWRCPSIRSAFLLYAYRLTTYQATLAGAYRRATGDFRSAARLPPLFLMPAPHARGTRRMAGIFWALTARCNLFSRHTVPSARHEVVRPLRQIIINVT